MNIGKVIKVYFVFVMVLFLIATLTYNQKFENYLLSVLHIKSVTSNSSVFTSLATSIKNDDADDKKKFVSANQNLSLINFDIINNPENSIVPPGSEDVNLMGLKFKTADENLFIEELTFLIVGVEPDKIEKVYLKDEDKIIAEGERKEDKIIFKNLNYKINQFNEKVVSVNLDLSYQLNTGQRFRFDIENPEDMKLIVDKDPYEINSYYPIKGKYLSIGRASN